MEETRQKLKAAVVDAFEPKTKEAKAKLILKRSEDKTRDVILINLTEDGRYIPDVFVVFDDDREFDELKKFIEK